jgi:hypothetical protein
MKRLSYQRNDGKCSFFTSSCPELLQKLMGEGFKAELPGNFDLTFCLFYRDDACSCQGKDPSCPAFTIKKIEANQPTDTELITANAI